MIRTLMSLVTAAALAAGPLLAQGGFLGVQLDSAPSGATGARIVSVQERSAASIMGLRAGDLVTSLDGVAIADSGALAAAVADRDPGEIVELQVQRDGESQTLLGVLARRPGQARSNLRLLAPDREPLILPPGDFRLEMPELDLHLRELQALPEDFAPKMEELERGLQDLQRQHRTMLENLHRSLQGFDWSGDLGWSRELFDRLDLEPRGGFSLRFEGEPHGIFLHPGEPLRADAQTQIRLRYPESTPEAERERLRREAVEKYGEAVVVEFAGAGTSVIIQRRSVGEAPAPQPEAGGAPETTREF